MKKKVKERSLFKQIKKINTEAFWQAIESTDTGIGIPDVFVQFKFTTKTDLANFTLQGITSLSLWIELKSVARRVTNQISPDWRPGQLWWAEQHKKRGGSWLLVIYINGRIYCTTAPQRTYRLSELKLYKGLTYYVEYL